MKSKASDSSSASPRGRAPLDAYREDLAKLAVRFSLAAGQDAKVISIVGMTPRAGTTTLAVSLARILASQEPSVTLVDANAAAPRVHLIMNTPPAPGVADVTDSGPVLDRALRSIDEGRMHVLPGGVWSDPRQAVSPGKWIELFARLRERGGRVLVDAGAMDSVNVEGIAAASDGVVLVLEAGRSRWEQVASFAARMGELGVPFLGVTVNKRRYPVPGFIYRRL